MKCETETTAEVRCPSCCEIVPENAHIYRCNVCGNECCTACTENGMGFEIICHDCE